MLVQFASVLYLQNLSNCVNSISLLTYRLGEQLLTEVNACLKRTLRLARLSMLGVLQTLLLYTPASNPASSPANKEELVSNLMTINYFKINLSFIKNEK